MLLTAISVLKVPEDSVSAVFALVGFVRSLLPYPGSLEPWRVVGNAGTAAVCSY